MSIDFPSNPVQGQVYTFNSSNWVYNGYAWIASYSSKEGIKVISLCKL